MAEKEHLPMERMEVFRRFVEIADWVWEMVNKWPVFARDTVGKQLIRAIDSVGANLVEGDGRYSYAESVHFFILARASAREACYWLERAIHRKLISPEEGHAKIAELSEALQLLNRLIAYRRAQKENQQLKETHVDYDISLNDPLIEE